MDQTRTREDMKLFYNDVSEEYSDIFFSRHKSTGRYDVLAVHVLGYPKNQVKFASAGENDYWQAVIRHNLSQNPTFTCLSDEAEIHNNVIKLLKSRFPRWDLIKKCVGRLRQKDPTFVIPNLPSYTSMDFIMEYRESTFDY